MKTTAIITLVGGAMLLSACDRTQYISEPVAIMTEEGEVTCQLYSPEYTIWDEALTFPATMNQAKADDFCRDEGERRRPE